MSDAPRDFECNVCHDDGYVVGTYRLCVCVGGQG